MTEYKARQPTLEESGRDSCRTLAHFVGARFSVDDELTQRKRDVLLEHLAWRLDKLHDSDLSEVLGSSWYDLLQADLREYLSPDAFDVARWATARRTRKVFGIVTVIKPELEAVLATFGRSVSEKEDHIAGPARFWNVEIPRDDDIAIEGVVTFVGKPRNVPCAIAVETLLAKYDLSILLLVGVAAGPRERVRLGDVVFAERVYDYEHVRLEVKRLFGIHTWLRTPLPRPEYFDAKQDVTSAAKLIKLGEVQRLVGAITRSYGGENNRWSSTDPHTLSIHTATVAAGEKLFADGSLARMVRAVDQRIRAGNQEDSGFAQAADYLEAKWAVFRGICDYGDPKKGDAWHFSASLAAACTAYTFLKDHWRDTRPANYEVGRTS